MKNLVRYMFKVNKLRGENNKKNIKLKYIINYDICSLYVYVCFLYWCLWMFLFL